MTFPAMRAFSTRINQEQAMNGDPEAIERLARMGVPLHNLPSLTPETIRRSPAASSNELYTDIAATNSDGFIPLVRDGGERGEK